MPSSASASSSSSPPSHARRRAPHRVRRARAYAVRVSAARLARARVHPPRPAHAPPCMPGAEFAKGLPHSERTGLPAQAARARLLRALRKPSPRRLARVPRGPPHGHPFRSGVARGAAVRPWEVLAPLRCFDLQAPDPHSLLMPPPPALASEELAHEMAELYWMALLRDVPLAHFSTAGAERVLRKANRYRDNPRAKGVFHTCRMVDQALGSLGDTVWVKGGASVGERKASARANPSLQTLFRGLAVGDHVGPYVSQFLLVGTKGIQGAYQPKDGYVRYGATTIDQRVRVAQHGKDFMTSWAAFVDVQNGADVRARAESYVQNNGAPAFRFITTGRDLATYVHWDLTYQAYLNACVILLDVGAPFQKGGPFEGNAFVASGGAHVLTSVAEVATRALKAVRFQKYNIHRRARPEAIAGLIDRFHGDKKNPLYSGVEPLYRMISKPLLRMIGDENEFQNSTQVDNGAPRSADLQVEKRKAATLLLPMAYPEGSPMHPSYGAGHAAMGGACVTILKAFFDTAFELPFAYVASDNGDYLKDAPHLRQKLTVEGELNKLCSNISIARNWAGVHYFSDYYESILLGEKVAIGLLEEQKMTYREDFNMTVPLFDGSLRHI